jgi:heme-degrading monooxygenase HmoA
VERVPAGALEQQGLVFPDGAEDGCGGDVGSIATREEVGVYARSTTVRADASRVEEIIAFVRDDVMSTVQTMEGFVGLSILVDRGSGRWIVTSSWATEEALRASAAGVRQVRAHAVKLGGRGEAEVRDWEVAVMRRAHGTQDGACTRVVWVRGDPTRTDAAVDAFRTRILPNIEQLAGVSSVSMMVDRRDGLTAVGTTYDSRDALARAGEQARANRDEFARVIGGQIADVGEFDLVLAHLRVPETA